jgi:hypothetical protein
MTKEEEYIERLLKDERLYFDTLQIMGVYGGGFVRSLVGPATLADSKNRERLVRAFAEIFWRYDPEKWR